MIFRGTLENLKYCADNDYVAIHVFGRERERERESRACFLCSEEVTFFKGILPCAPGIGIGCLIHLYIFILNDLYRRFSAYSLG